MAEVRDEEENGTMKWPLGKVARYDDGGKWEELLGFARVPDSNGEALQTAVGNDIAHIVVYSQTLLRAVEAFLPALLLSGRFIKESVYFTRF